MNNLYKHRELLQGSDLEYRAYAPYSPEDSLYKHVVSAERLHQRKKELISQMDENGLDAVVIYGDREHFGNIKCFTGFDPRFEEALLIIHKDGRMFSALGNECYGLAAQSPVEITPVYCPILSLPNQPTKNSSGLGQCLRDCGLNYGMQIGTVDWKIFTDAEDSNEGFFPAYIYRKLEQICGRSPQNVTDLLMHPDYGLRVLNSCDEIAELEYGATIASRALWDVMKAAIPGKTESSVAIAAKSYGQPLSTHPTLKAGINAHKSMFSPTDNVLREYDEISFTYGVVGGLSCRRGYLSKELPPIGMKTNEYLERFVQPYMATVFNWYRMIQIGRKCGDIYDMVEEGLPQQAFGWSLNPGHYLGYEEWLSSPFYKGSDICLKSGMVLQMDIIPSHPNMALPKCEDGICIADAALQAELAEKYPDTYARFMQRRVFMQEQLGLSIAPELLPMSDYIAAYNPFLLNQNMAIVIK